MGVNNRHIGLPLFQMEEGIVMVSLLRHGVVEFPNMGSVSEGLGFSPFGKTGEGFVFEAHPDGRD